MAIVITSCAALVTDGQDRTANALLHDLIPRRYQRSPQLSNDFLRWANQTIQQQNQNTNKDNSSSLNPFNDAPPPSNVRRTTN